MQTRLRYGIAVAEARGYSSDLTHSLGTNVPQGTALKRQKKIIIIIIHTHTHTHTHTHAVKFTFSGVQFECLHMLRIL